MMPQLLMKEKKKKEFNLAGEAVVAATAGVAAVVAAADAGSTQPCAEQPTAVVAPIPILVKRQLFNSCTDLIY